MKAKRKVSANLGRTQHRIADKLYDQIRKRIGPSRECPFYKGKKYTQFRIDEHDRLNPRFPNPLVPVEEFDFARKSNGVWGLQAYCKVCYKAYRRGRIELARRRFSHMSEEKIRRWYRKNHTPPTMRCSVCHKDLDPSKFPISKSMEKGLHNECFDCIIAKGTSVREQAWLAEGDWDSWRKAVIKMRKEPVVQCAGWPPAVAAGLCKGEDSGKRMHADHKVPLRAGGINDVRNFQPLCTRCNSIKSDQLDIRLSSKQISNLVGTHYRRSIRREDSVQTTERRLKAGLVAHIESLEIKGRYLFSIRMKKKEINGQWSPEYVYRKGLKWLERGGYQPIKE